MIVLVLFTALIGYIASFVWQRKRVFRFREEIGLKGPPPNFFIGNLGIFLERVKSTGYDDGYKMTLDLCKEYGNTHALYFGPQLNIFSTDPEFIREVFIKQFAKFGDRMVPPILKQNGLNHSLTQMTKDSGWKDCRRCMSPHTSNVNMKLMHDSMMCEIDLFLTIIDEHVAKGEKFNIYDDLQALAIDVIGKCALAIDINCQRNRNEMFFIQSQEVFRQTDLNMSSLLPLSAILPEFSRFWKIVFPFSGMRAAEVPLLEGLERIYEVRKANMDTESRDVFQSFLNKEDSQGGPLTKQQVIENSLGILLPGYKTISSALGFCCHLLGTRPKIQEKLYQEIQETRESQELNFDTIRSLPYLDAVYKETLRYYPPVLNLTGRVCLEETEVCGIRIPKGSWITVNPYAIHHKEENWENPEEFRPDRFLDWNEKNSLKWIPFGVGPRHCIGMRFSEMEIKMVLAGLIDRYEITIPEEDRILRNMSQGFVMVPVGNTINAVLMRRK